MSCFPKPQLSFASLSHPSAALSHTCSASLASCIVHSDKNKTKSLRFPVSSSEFPFKRLLSVTAARHLTKSASALFFQQGLDYTLIEFV